MPFQDLRLPYSLFYGLSFGVCWSLPELTLCLVVSLAIANTFQILGLFSLLPSVQWRQGGVWTPGSNHGYPSAPLGAVNQPSEKKSDSNSQHSLPSIMLSQEG